MEATNEIQKQNLRSIRVDKSQLDDLGDVSQTNAPSQQVSDLSLPEIVVHVPTLEKHPAERQTSNPVSPARRTHVASAGTSNNVTSPPVSIGHTETQSFQPLPPQQLFEDAIATSLDQEELVKQLLSQITPSSATHSTPKKPQSTTPNSVATKSTKTDCKPVEQGRSPVEPSAIVPKRASEVKAPDAKPSEAKPSEVKATEAKALEAKPSSTQADRKRALVRPAVVNKPERSKPAGPIFELASEQESPAAPSNEIQPSSRVAQHPTSNSDAVVCRLVDDLDETHVRTLDRSRPSDFASPIQRNDQTALPRDQAGAEPNQYLDLVDNLVAQSITPESSLLMFTTAGSISSASDHLEQVANHYLDRVTHSKVLLIDGRMSERQLSRRLSAVDSPGLAEAIHGSTGWRELIRTTRHPNLSFLPAGNGFLTFRRATRERLGELCMQWKQSFGCVIIDGGERDGMIPRLLCPFCDATYLMVTLGLTGQTEAKAAVTELRAYGARLLGCITTN